jgi:ribokinase
MEPNDENFLKFKKEVPCNLIVTLGEKGAVLVSEDETQYFNAPTVEAIDTTGAGDSFIGTFAYELSESSSPEDCIKKSS